MAITTSMATVRTSFTIMEAARLFRSALRTFPRQKGDVAQGYDHPRKGQQDGADDSGNAFCPQLGLGVFRRPHQTVPPVIGQDGGERQKDKKASYQFDPRNAVRGPMPAKNSVRRQRIWDGRVPDLRNV